MSVPLLSPRDSSTGVRKKKERSIRRGMPGPANSKSAQDTPSIKEPKISPTSIEDNLTGGQIQEVLDLLIFESVAPIILASDVFDIQMVYLLGLAARNKKRKLSALPREEFLSAICRALSTNNRFKKLEIISEAKIERGFIYKFVVNFLTEAADYVTLYQRHFTCTDRTERESLGARMAAIESSLRVSRDELFSTINASRDYLDLMYQFRNGIVNNYLKLAYQAARSYTSQKGPNFSFEDVYQNFLTVVTKAIDKYDASKGALTSYIKWWLLNAQTTTNTDHGHEYGIAYTLPQTQKKNLATNENANTQVNFSVSLNKLVGKDGEETELQHHLQGSEGVDKEIEHRQELDQIRYLIKKADIRGLARLVLEIDEYFSKKELNQMRETMKAQLGESNEYRKTLSS